MSERRSIAWCHVRRATRRKQARLYAFLGAKGGVGTTTVAVNVATALAQAKAGRVLLIDLHPAHGDARSVPRRRAAFLDYRCAREHASDGRRVFQRPRRTHQSRSRSARFVRSASRDAGRHSTRSHSARVRLGVPTTTSSSTPRGPTPPCSTHSKAPRPSSSSRIRNCRPCAARRAWPPRLRQRYGRERVQIVVTRYDTVSEIGQEDIERATGGAMSTPVSKQLPAGCQRAEQRAADRRREPQQTGCVVRRLRALSGGSGETRTD